LHCDYGMLQAEVSTIIVTAIALLYDFLLHAASTLWKNVSASDSTQQKMEPLQLHGNRFIHKAAVIASDSYRYGNIGTVFTIVADPHPHPHESAWFWSPGSAFQMRIPDADAG
jgi:hypothetical protein